jgi:putative PIN family toxin of toxin-antitoxin system
MSFTPRLERAQALVTVVLDTNVILDWLVFRNPTCIALEREIACGSLRWIATAAMRAELRWSLSDRLCARWYASREQVLAFAEQLSSIVAVPPPDPKGRMHCTDADDQMFIDLALSCGACWLLTRDRALLKLGRRARRRGVAVCSPADWAGASKLPSV